MNLTFFTHNKIGIEEAKIPLKPSCPMQPINALHLCIPEEEKKSHLYVHWDA